MSDEDTNSSLSQQPSAQCESEDSLRDKNLQTLIDMFKELLMAREIPTHEKLLEIFAFAESLLGSEAMLLKIDEVIMQTISRGYHFKRYTCDDCGMPIDHEMRHAFQFFAPFNRLSKKKIVSLYTVLKTYKQ